MTLNVLVLVTVYIVDWTWQGAILSLSPPYYNLSLMVTSILAPETIHTKSLPTRDQDQIPVRLIT